MHWYELVCMIHCKLYHRYFFFFFQKERRVIQEYVLYSVICLKKMHTAQRIFFPQIEKHDGKSLQ